MARPFCCWPWPSPGSRAPLVASYSGESECGGGGEGDASAARACRFAVVDAADKGTLSTGEVGRRGGRGAGRERGARLETPTLSPLRPQAPDAASLAARLGVPERDARLLMPALPGGPPAPALVASRGRATLVGLEGVRLAITHAAAFVLAAPPTPLGALDGACAPPGLGAPLVGELSAAARAHGPGPAFAAAALDAALDAVVAALDARAAACDAEAAAAADAVAARIDRAALEALRRAKAGLIDLKGAAGRVSRALRPRRARNARAPWAAAADAAAARAARAAAAGDAASGAVRAAESAARMDARRRSLGLLATI
jgi:hypothetical protein